MVEKKRRNLTVDPLTQRIIEGKKSDEICYLIQLGDSHRTDLEVVSLTNAMFEEVQELKEITKSLALLIIEKDQEPL